MSSANGTDKPATAAVTTAISGSPALDNAKTLSYSSSNPSIRSTATDDGRDITIPIDDRRFMMLQKENLFVEIREEKTLHVCGMPFSTYHHETTRTIPLHTILWVERNESKLEITYAEPDPSSKHRLRPVVLSLAVTSDEPASGQDTSLDAFAEILLTRAYVNGRAPRRKRAKVLINPHAGPGGALQKWHRDVEPLFLAARMVLDVHTTTHHGEAVDIARDLNIDAFDAVVACSGDGLPYEIWNGLASRSDAGRALRTIKVCQIPCGSGNAMACNLYGSYQLSASALGIIKGIETAMDLVSFTQSGEERKLSFLSQAVGLLAEADLGTEHMRWMGAARFQVGTLTRIFKKKAYPCDLDLKVESDDKDTIRAAYRRRLGEKEAESGANPGDATIEHSDEELAGLPPLKFGTADDLLPEEGWQRIKYENMANVYCGNMAYVAPDTVFFPACVPDDGFMDLVTINSDIPVTQAVGMVFSCGPDGAFFAHPHVTYRKISAFRLTPRDQNDGYISVDGERVPFKPIQAEVHPGLGRVYSVRGRFETRGPKGWRES